MLQLNREGLSQLVEQAENDPASFDRIYEYFYPKIYNYISFRVSNKFTAEDLVSEIFIKAFCSLAKCKNKKQFENWLFTTARNHLVDFYR